MAKAKSDFFKKLQPVLNTAIKFKRVMQAKKLSAAKTKCPHCKDGLLHGRLSGPKDHFRMYCDKCEIGMME